jgi:tetratricopeptide (TPR) repeat protein
LFLVASVGTPLTGQDKKAPPSIEELVADLGSEVYAKREKAQLELWLRGDQAIPALQKALEDESPEVVRRAREVLDKFAWGVRPNTPPEVLKLLRQFQSGDNDPVKSAEVRKNAILALLRHGPAGVSVARALLGKPLPDHVHAQVRANITALIRREVPLRVFEGKTDAAADLIAIHTAGTGPEGAADYAVFHALRGSLPAAIAEAEVAIKAGRQTTNHKLLLAHLYRASGEWEKARAAAADLTQPQGEPSLTELLREEEGDWSTLADTLAFAGANHPDALRLSILRLAGRQKAFDTEVKSLLKATNEFSSDEEAREAVIALFANNRAEDATRILRERKQNLGLLGEVFISRLRYKEALDLIAADDTKQLSPREKLEFNLRRARILMLTGDREGAVQLFGSVAERLSLFENLGDSSSPITAVRSLLRTEMRVGLKDLAAEHAAQFVASGTFSRHGQSYTGESAFELLFNQDSTVAETLFWALRHKKIPGEEPGPTMIRTRELLTGKSGKAAVDEALRALREAEENDKNDPVIIPPRDVPEDQPLPPVVRSRTFMARQYLAQAAVCRAASRDEDADAAFKAAVELTSEATSTAGARSWVYGTSDAYRPFVDWGDSLFERGRFQAAADTYLEGWKKFPEQPLPMFLSGKALVKLGELKEGQRRIELSHWVALGQERIRGRFIEELVRRGEGKAARREAELVLRACWCRDHYFGNVMNQAAKAAVLVKDFATAEKCGQRSMLLLLKTPGMYYVETSAYMNVPHDIFVYRARAKLADGKVEEALALARNALAVTPGHIDLVSGMVPDLEKRGKKAEADELFDTAWKAYQKVLSDFPNSPSARNALALLAANCRRELDKGLTYAKEAVKAEPSSLAYRETLAEVYFRSGEREKALDVMLKLTGEDPRNMLYKRQLLRYRSAPFDSPKPDSED